MHNWNYILLTIVVLIFLSCNGQVKEEFQLLRPNAELVQEKLNYHESELTKLEHVNGYHFSINDADVYLMMKSNGKLYLGLELVWYFP